MATTRETMRTMRREREIPAVAIAGYTNAGKSSLLNRLTGAGVLVEDALFATLDPTVRRARTPEGRIFTLADTVGFVRHLPHQLVEAFRSTLEEVADADLILHVVDGSHPDPQSQLAAVRQVLAEIGAADIPEIVVINKADVADPVGTGEGINELMRVIERELPRLDHEVRVLVPYDRGDLISRAHREGEVLSVEHTGDGTILHARVLGDLFGELDRVGKPVETV
jgi:GTP-binding protein HflX